MILIAVAKILAPHGIRGEVKIMPLTDFPERFYETKELMLTETQTWEVESVRPHGAFFLVKFRGFDTPEAWAPFRGRLLHVPENQLVPLPEGHYYIHQIIGLEVFDVDGHSLGIVEDLIQTGSNDVYVVKTSDGKETLVPAIKSVVRSIDISDGRIIVTMPEVW
jgi:16S rRNA processing protein RimM